MRPIDLLAFRVDDDHKMFLKVSHEHEKNYKIKKQYQAYSWGRNDDFLLGYPTLTEEKKSLKRIIFGTSTAEVDSKFDSVSVKDIVSANTFTLALTEDGNVFSWGRGHYGHLGNGDE
jgi:alpha-tubulin suppressor-like RCC1 family protein